MVSDDFESEAAVVVDETRQITVVVGKFDQPDKVGLGDEESIEQRLQCERAGAASRRFEVRDPADALDTRKRALLKNPVGRSGLASEAAPSFMGHAFGISDPSACVGARAVDGDALEQHGRSVPRPRLARMGAYTSRT